MGAAWSGDTVAAVSLYPCLLDCCRSYPITFTTSAFPAGAVATGPRRQAGHVIDDTAMPPDSTGEGTTVIVAPQTAQVSTCVVADMLAV